MISYHDCIGCQACVDLCPQKAITFQYDQWGEGRATVNTELCNDCRLCELRCPARTNDFCNAQQIVYAAISKSNRKTGSSGGVFYELASQHINNGGVVFGAAFDRNLKLVHKKASSLCELDALCKSKYLHSDMTGIYNEIANCLKDGLQVMYVGTPCQVSAVKNAFQKKYGSQLFLVDFLCHGTGTQKCFDMCISAEEKKKNGKITEFSFRAKSRKAEHSYRYKIKRGSKEKTISGYAFEFPYYNAYLKYCIFNEYCYSCQYTCHERIGDVTLGDFWGVKKYNKDLDDEKGVSMISVNTTQGMLKFNNIKGNCDVYEFPIQNASDHNQSFKERLGDSYYVEKRKYTEILSTQGEDALVEKMSCHSITKWKLYAMSPMFLKKLWSGIRKGLKRIAH